MNCAAGHTTTTSISHLIPDVFSAPVRQHCLNDLLTECEPLDSKFGSKWNRTRMTEMRTIDSALPECIRFSPSSTLCNTRRVVAPDGVILPNDTWLLCGSVVQIAAYSGHHDESLYSEPLKCRHTSFMQTNKDGTPLKSATAVEPTFLKFGHGRHACSVRFLAADMMKLMMTNLMINYEVKPFSERPKNKWLTEFRFPPLDATLKVRQHAGTVIVP